jgi:hypothetical protein
VPLLKPGNSENLKRIQENVIAPLLAHSADDLSGCGDLFLCSGLAAFAEGVPASRDIGRDGNFYRRDHFRLGCRGLALGSAGSRIAVRPHGTASAIDGCRRAPDPDRETRAVSTAWDTEASR